MSGYLNLPDGLVADVDGAVLRVVIDRPERRNALTDDIVLALVDLIDTASSDDAIRVISLAGRGESFCSGFDLGGRAREPDAPRPRPGSVQRRMRWHVNRLIPAMLEAQTPIVTAARGWAIGLGLHIVLASDFAVVADDARLWAPFTRFGFTPDSGGSWLIPRLVGVARAKEMLMLGREVSGTRAAEWGLVHRAVPGPDVDTAAAALIDELASAATVAVGLTKYLVHRGVTADLDAQLGDEGLAMELASRTEDFREYGRSRGERRDPDYRGR
ncbi:MAG TPA: enoyl-CoA hydratase-related protein [Acidimicrobiia bacterium]|nr:enoyl-CoA hydratase-related protein [Acidimicrobiia bacterium]